MKRYQPVGVGMTPCETELGSFIRSYRLKLGLRQDHLARQAGLKQNLISMLEIGKRNCLKDFQLNNLAAILRCDPEELRKLMPVRPLKQPKTKLGKLIRSRREEIGLTQEDFANKMGISNERARHLEIRSNGSIRYESVRLLASALNIEPAVLSEFFGVTREAARNVPENKLGQLIRDRRRILVMSTQQLAEKLGVTRQLISQIELGHYSLSKNDDMIRRIAEAIGLDVADLFSVRPARKIKQVAIKPNTLGGFLATKRLELCLTQRQVGELAGTVAVVISNIETGRTRPSHDLLKKMEEVLSLKVPRDLLNQMIQKRGVTPRFIKKRETALGSFVTRKRIESNLSQAQFAERAEIKYYIVTGIELGTYIPRRFILKKIANALGCEIPDVLVKTKIPK